MLKVENFRKAKKVNFEDLHDRIIDNVHIAMEDAKLPDDQFANWKGTSLINNETDEVLAIVSDMCFVSQSVYLQCEDGVVRFDLNIFG